MCPRPHRWLNVRGGTESTLASTTFYLMSIMFFLGGGSCGAGRYYFLRVHGTWLRACQELGCHGKLKIKKTLCQHPQNPDPHSAQAPHELTSSPHPKSRDHTAESRGNLAAFLRMKAVGLRTKDPMSRQGGHQRSHFRVTLLPHAPRFLGSPGPALRARPRTRPHVAVTSSAAAAATTYNGRRVLWDPVGPGSPRRTESAEGRGEGRRGGRGARGKKPMSLQDRQRRRQRRHGRSKRC